MRLPCRVVVRRYASSCVHLGGLEAGRRHDRLRAGRQAEGKLTESRGFTNVRDFKKIEQNREDGSLLRGAARLSEPRHKTVMEKWTIDHSRQENATNTRSDIPAGNAVRHRQRLGRRKARTVTSACSGKDKEGNREGARVGPGDESRLKGAVPHTACGRGPYTCPTGSVNAWRGGAVWLWKRETRHKGCQPWQSLQAC